AAVTRPRASAPPSGPVAPFVTRPARPSEPPRAQPSTQRSEPPHAQRSEPSHAQRSEPSRAQRSDAPRVARPAMTAGSLMEDDDLEPTNPSIIPKDDGLVLLDETTNRDGNTTSSGRRR